MAKLFSQIVGTTVVEIFILKIVLWDSAPAGKLRRPNLRMAARGQSTTGVGSGVEESEVVGVWGRRSAHTQEEGVEPPYLLPPPQLRIQHQYLAVSAVPLRFLSLPLGPSLVLPYSHRRSPRFLSC